MPIFSIDFFWITIAPSWYGLMYVMGFLFWYKIIQKRKFVDNEKLDDLLFYMFLWVILWWRWGYVLFYNFMYYIYHPLEIFFIWEWWMSFHGWVIWVILMMIIYAKKYKLKFLDVSDQVTSVLPIWLWLWRIGNYLNKELLWMPYDWFLAVKVWEMSYFPSPLLEALLEWILLFSILTWIINHKNYPWKVSANFILWYWIFRLWIEFVRLPDAHIGYLFWTSYLTVWMMLSLPMIFVWLSFILWVGREK